MSCLAALLFGETLFSVAFAGIHFKGFTDPEGVYLVWNKPSVRHAHIQQEEHHEESMLCAHVPGSAWYVGALLLATLCTEWG